MDTRFYVKVNEVDEVKYLTIKELFERQRTQRPKMIIYKCPNNHLRQELEGKEVICNQCGERMIPR